MRRIAVVHLEPVQDDVDLDLLSDGLVSFNADCQQMLLSAVVVYAVSVCVLTRSLTGSPSRTKRKPEVDLRVYKKAVDVSIGSPPPCAKSRGPAARFARGCLSANVSV